MYPSIYNAIMMQEMISRGAWSVCIICTYLLNVVLRNMFFIDEFSRGMIEEYYNLNIAEQLCR